MGTQRYEVAILGSGLGGSMLASILARHGVSTLLLEGASHPRFAIGESLIPETGLRLRIVAEKYGVPEIGWIGTFHQVRRHVSSNCGVKRSFGFMYHRPGEENRPEEINQFGTLAPPVGPDSHLFRQDTDAFLAATSVRYGAVFHSQTRIDDITFGEDEVTLHAASGETYRAKLLIDASGMRSMVSDQLGMRDETPRFRTNTRAIYTHMMGVRSADLLLTDKGRQRLLSPLGQSTMHHVFDGGWMWIIPFGNHRDATNPLTSVGLMLDRNKFGEPHGTPEQEFRRIIANYPTVARHLADARAARPWVRSGRIQYSSPHLTAPRLIQLPHAAAFIDPLYSSGMSVLIAAVDLIADELLRAVVDDDYAVERFKFMEDVVNRGFDHYDTIVSGSFDSFASYETWNAWNRNWVMGSLLGTFGPLSLLTHYHRTKDRAYLDKTIEPSRIGVLGSHLPGVVEMARASRTDMDAALAGQLSYQQVSDRIFARFREIDFLPPYMGFGDPAKSMTATFTLIPGARHVLWYRRHGDPVYRDNCTFPLTTYARDGAGFVLGEMRDAWRNSVSAVRDVFFADNRDWRHPAPALAAHPELVTPVPAFAPTPPEPDELNPDELNPVDGPLGAASPSGAS